MNFENQLENYADLAVRTGINLQEGQRLVISAPIGAAPFVRAVAKKAYAAGAKDVYVDWSDDELTVTKYTMAPKSSFTDYPTWKAEGFVDMARDNSAFLTISAPNPLLLRGVDPERVATWNKAGAMAMKDYAQMRQTGQFQWCMVSVPTLEWAGTVFPNVPAAEAVDRLWSYIFKATRADLDNPVQAWKEHIQHLNNRLELLNGKQYRRLHVTANGTDLDVELPKDHVWIGGGLTQPNGVFFTPNIPTEEVFTAPVRSGVNGHVQSTKPLNYNGSLIEDFTLRFEQGKVVDFEAKHGEETLRRLLETDDGACFLGEFALVPQSSPIAQLNVIFNNTLYDENASCHIALGAAYPICIQDGGKMTREELRQNGVNTSIVHVDFMIGSDTFNIVAETGDGQREELFRNGNWA